MWFGTYVRFKFEAVKSRNLAEDWIFYILTIWENLSILITLDNNLTNKLTKKLHTHEIENWRKTTIIYTCLKYINIYSWMLGVYQRETKF